MAALYPRFRAVFMRRPNSPGSTGGIPAVLLSPCLFVLTLWFWVGDWLFCCNRCVVAGTVNSGDVPVVATMPGTRAARACGNGTAGGVTVRTVSSASVIVQFLLVVPSFYTPFPASSNLHARLQRNSQRPEPGHLCRRPYAGHLLYHCLASAICNRMYSTIKRSTIWLWCSSFWYGSEDGS